MYLCISILQNAGELGSAILLKGGKKRNWGLGWRKRDFKKRKIRKEGKYIEMTFNLGGGHWGKEKILNKGKTSFK